MTPGSTARPRHDVEPAGLTVGYLPEDAPLVRPTLPIDEPRSLALAPLLEGARGGRAVLAHDLADDSLPESQHEH